MFFFSVSCGKTKPATQFQHVVAISCEDRVVATTFAVVAELHVTVLRKAQLPQRKQRVSYAFRCSPVTIHRRNCRNFAHVKPGDLLSGRTRLARPSSVRLYVPYWLITRKQKKRRKVKIGVDVPGARVNGVPIFSRKGQRSRSQQDVKNRKQCLPTRGHPLLGLIYCRHLKCSVTDGRPHIMSALGADIFSGYITQRIKLR